MVWIEQRERTSGAVSWRVMWRQDGRKQQQTFDDRDLADYFLEHVKLNRDRWPRGWVKGQGWVDEIDGLEVESFRDYAERTIAARNRADVRTKDDYRRMLRNHVYPVIGALPLTRVTRFEVSRIAQLMHEAGKSAKTIANVHGLVSSILSDAVADELLRRNPAAGALPNLPEVKTEEMVFLSVGEVAMILDQIRNDTYRDLARVLVVTGMRWSEATALQVGDVEILTEHSGRLHVRRAWKRRGGMFVMGGPKTNRSRRTLDVSSELVDVLLPHLVGKNPETLVFTTAQGRPVRHSTFYGRHWVPAVNRARRCPSHAAEKEPCGCPGTLTKQPAIHALRHTHASWLLADGNDLVAIQRRLGHESIQTTIDRYSHLAPAHADKINASVDQALSAFRREIPYLT